MAPFGRLHPSLVVSGWLSNIPWNPSTPPRRLAATLNGLPPASGCPPLSFGIGEVVGAGNLMPWGSVAPAIPALMTKTGTFAE